MLDLHHATVVELAAAIRNGQLDPVDLLEAHITRLLEVNGALNAIAEVRFDAARKEARAASRAVAAAASPDELPVLHGIPCTIKEFLAIDGMKQTGGLLASRDYVSSEDATVVRRLRNAGAIIMATTNVPEAGMWMETYNLIYGRTNNPWNVAHTPGGSSGGEAALVAAGAAPFGIGSDIGGSVRIPAAFCGICAHKPTGRMVPNTGHWGPDDHGTEPFLTIGPMTRSAEDLSLLLRIIAGPDDRDTFTEAWAIGDEDEVDFSSMTVCTIKGFGGFQYSKESMRARDRAVECLTVRGARVREIEVDGLKRARAVWARAMEDAAGTDFESSFAYVLGDGVSPVRVVPEALRFAIGRPRFTAPAIGFLALEKLVPMVPRAFSASVPSRADVYDELRAAIGSGVLIHPSYTRAAPRHHRALLTPLHAVTTGVFNVLEMPASQVPIGFSTRGLPLGVQVVADRGCDHVAIAAARVIENDLGRLGVAPAS